KIRGSFSQVAVRNRFATVGFVPHLFVSMRFLRPFFQPHPSHSHFVPLPVSLHCPLLAILDTKRTSNKYKPNGTCKNNVHF
ncbi:hypothetical protein N332_12114, partial [Mesitornis unicolor]